MDSEATKAKKKKTKGVFAVVVKKRGSGSKVQKKRKLKRLQKVRDAIAVVRFARMHMQ